MTGQSRVMETSTQPHGGSVRTVQAPFLPLSLHLLRRKSRAFVDAEKRVNFFHTLRVSVLHDGLTPLCFTQEETPAGGPHRLELQHVHSVVSTAGGAARPPC